MNNLLPKLKRKLDIKYKADGFDMGNWTLEDLENTYGLSWEAIQLILKRCYMYRATGFCNPRNEDFILTCDTKAPSNFGRATWSYIGDGDSPRTSITRGTTCVGPRIILERI